MKDEESHHRNSDNSKNNRADNNCDCRIDIASIEAQKVNYQIDDSHDYRAHYSGQKQHEKSIVPFADTVINKRAVMIENFHTVLAGGAMTSSARTIYVTG